MIDNIMDSAGADTTKKIDNKEQGTRVKKYAAVPNGLFFDNYLRYKISDIYRMILKYFVLLTLLIIVIGNTYNADFSENSQNQVIKNVKNDLEYIFLVSLNKIASNYAGNINNITILISDSIPQLEVPEMDLHFSNELITFWILLSLVLGGRILISIYMLMAQRAIFSLGIVHWYVHPFLLINYFLRNKNQYMYLKVVPHQKVSNLATTIYQDLVMTFFNEDIDPITQKVVVKTSPKDFLNIWHFIKLEYQILDK